MLLHSTSQKANTTRKANLRRRMPKQKKQQKAKAAAKAPKKTVAKKAAPKKAAAAPKKAAPPPKPAAPKKAEVSSKKSKTGPTLHYWNGRGLMEVPRFCLAIAGKFPGAGYTDNRYSGTEGHGNKFDANLGRMPICETELGSSIGQAKAINFYVASECGLMGVSTFQTAQILSFVEHISECTETCVPLRRPRATRARIVLRGSRAPTLPPPRRYRKAVPYGSTPTPAQLNTWFDDKEASDLSGVANMANRSQRQLTWFLGRMERLVGNSGFAVGSKLTLADVRPPRAPPLVPRPAPAPPPPTPAPPRTTPSRVQVMLYNAFAESLAPKDAKDPNMPAHRREPFASAARTAKALKSCPKISKCIAAVASHPNIKKWLATRGPQGF